MRRLRGVLVVVVLVTSCTAGPGADRTGTTGPTDGAQVDAVATGSETESQPRQDPAAGPEPSDVDDGGPATLVMWGHGGLSRDVAAAARSLDDVVAVGFRRRETVGLVRAVTAAGEVVVDLTDGFRLPLQAVSLDPGSGLADAVAHEALAPGTVLLPETSASVRGLGVGATIDIVGRAGLVVAAVIPDAATGTNELVLHPDDADALGWDDDGALVLEHDRADPASLEVELLSLVPAEVTARVVHPDESGARAASLVLPSVEVKRQFGEFAYRPRTGVREIDIEGAWVDANIVTADVPLLGTVRCHREIVDDLDGVLAELDERGFGDTIDPAAYAGCFYARQTGTSPDASLSRHSWGIALDINVDLSVAGGGVPLPTEVIEVFERRGFRWGGNFLVPDNHHFEWVGPPTP